ncbi:tRNA dimethylallyltransferase [Babesia ovis]|uniref:tRNA dimethylallyltransferase n=1 Tax=Babesia ovis TaxID=5869 RepID=A0A9W5TAK1_BABOV|nr:tRNA dimethylallyltransferase [Babesia ovis]
MNKLNDTSLDIMNTSRTVTNRDEGLVTRGLRGKIVIILGPTATGKTDASIEVALKLKEHNIKAEIINTDSMQIYEGFDIGTAKPTTQQMETIKHHLIGFIPATQHYNVAQYVHTTTALIAQMHANNILPILVGGSNMYVEGLLWPSVMDMQMEETGHNTLELYEKLRMLDPERAAELHMNDRKRITRSLDVVKRSGMKHSELIMIRRNEKNKSGPKYDSLMFAMLCETAEHKRRIKERTRKMLEDGILEECNQLVELIGTECLL